VLETKKIEKKEKSFLESLLSDEDSEWKIKKIVF
jgi:hypothetical protein